MKRLLIVALVFFIGGCGVLDSGSSLADKVKAVQDEAVKLCAYLPTATSVSAIITAGDPTVVGISAVANAICTAMINWQTDQKTVNSFATDCPRVNGVCVEGSYTKPKKGN